MAECTEQITYERKKGPKASRPTPAETFAHVPVTETVEILSEPAKRNPDLYEKIDEERTFKIGVLPPKLVKREIVRPKHRHRLGDRYRAPVVAAGSDASRAERLLVRQADRLDRRQ